VKLIDIVEQQAKFTRNSGVEVEIDSAMGTVNIFETDNPNCCVFLQGDEGYQWIAGALRLWNEAEHISMEIAELAQAYPYLDILAEVRSD